MKQNRDHVNNYTEGKKNYMNELLRETEQDHTQGRIRKFFVKIKKYKQFNPNLKAVKDINDNILIDPIEKVTKWKNYFEELLNSEVPVRPVPTRIDHRAEQEVNDVSMQEVKEAINSLKNWKASGTDGIPVELIKYDEEALHQAIYELCQKIWNDEELSEEWNKAIVVPLHKKGDKLSCNNYRGISLLNTTYKVFSQILLGRLQPFADECMGDTNVGSGKENQI